MTIVAVTRASGQLGRAVVARLDAEPTVTRILGVDVTEPEMPCAKLEFRTADVRDPLLPRAFDGADVVVHLSSADEHPPPAGPWLAREYVDEDTHFAMTVHGTRNALAAAGKAGAHKVVHLSSGLCYGAHPDNPVPLDESARLRANPDFSDAYHELLAEELVTTWAAEHPDATVSVVRPAVVLGHADDVFARHLEAPRLATVRGYAPPWQFTHPEDVAAAIVLAVIRDLPGAYNVASDGWLSTEELCGLLGRKPVAVPEQVAFSTSEQLERWGLSPVPTGALHYLMHPLVLATDRLHAQGWSPTWTNREIVRAFAEAHRGYVTLGRVRLRRMEVYVGALSGIGLLLGLWLGRRVGRRV